MSCSLKEHKRKSWLTVSDKLDTDAKTIKVNNTTKTVVITPSKASKKLKQKDNAFQTAKRLQGVVEKWAAGEYGESFKEGWTSLNTANRDNIIINYHFPQKLADAITYKLLAEEAEAQIAAENLEIEEAQNIFSAERRVLIDRQRKIDIHGDNLKQLVSSDTPVDPKIEAKMQQLMSDMGIDIINYDEYAKFYEEKYGEKLTAVAVADLMNRVIAVRDGSADKGTLPHEIGHFIEFALTGDKRLQYAIDNVHLTDLWAKQSEVYMKEYNNDENKVRREIVGQLIGQSLIDNIENEKPSWKRTMLQLWSKFLNFFMFGTKKREARMRNTIDSIAQQSLYKTKSLKKALESRPLNEGDVLFKLDPKDFENSKLLEGERENLIKALNIVKNKIKISEHKEFRGYAQEERQLRKKIEEALEEFTEEEGKEASDNRITLGLIEVINTIEEEAKDVLKSMRSIEANMKEGVYDNQLNDFSKLIKEMNDYILV